MLEVYRVKDLEYSHEKRQAKELIDTLNIYFNRYQNETQYIVIDPRANGLPQIDAILYFRGYTIILELKDYKNRIYPKFHQPWEAEDKLGIKYLLKKVENPFYQVRRQREKYVKFFAEKVFDQLLPEISGDVENKIWKNLHAWIVTSRNSEIILGKIELKWWNKVMPLNHELIKELSLFGKEPKNSITENEFLRFIGGIEAVKPSPGYWNTGSVVPELEDSKSYIVEKLLLSFEPDEVKKGLNYSKELKLINNFELIKTSLPPLNDDLKEYGYRILFDWLKEYPNKYIGKAEDLLRCGLSDKNHTIRKIALEYLVLGTKLYGIELLQFIHEKLRTEMQYENIALIVKSMESFNNRTLISQILKDLYNKRIFKNYYDKTIEANQLIAEKEEIVGNTKRLESEASYSRVSCINEKLRKIFKYISQLDNVLKNIFEVSVTLELKDIGDYSWKFFDFIYETHKGGYERFISATNEFKFTLNVISALKPKGVTDKLVSVLHDTTDDYLKYLIIKTLGELGDSSMIGEILPFLSYDNEMGDVQPEHMKIQASDALSKLSDFSSFNTILKLFVSQEDKEVSLEGDKSYLRSLRKLDRQKLEIEIWKQIENSRDLRTGLVTYSNAIRDCGGELSLMKLKNILIEKGDIFGNWWYAPSSTIVALPWLNPSLKTLGLQTGLEFLKSGREELEYIGLELSEEHFLSNESELEKYETSQNERILNLIIYFYSRNGNKKKILKFLENKVSEVTNFAFQTLTELMPENHYENFYLIHEDHVDVCGFIVTDFGLALQLKNVSGHIVQGDKSVQFLSWNSITGMKSILKEKSLVGLLFMYKGGGVRPSGLISRDVVQWNYLITDSIRFNSKISETVNKIDGYIQKNKFSNEIVSTPELLLNILKKTFMKEQVISSFGSKDSTDQMSKLFDEHFKADLMNLL